MSRSDEMEQRANSLRELAIKYAEGCHESLAMQAETAAALYNIASELVDMRVEIQIAVYKIASELAEMNARQRGETT